MPPKYSRCRDDRLEVASSCSSCSQPSGQRSHVVAVRLVFYGLTEI